MLIKEVARKKEINGFSLCKRGSKLTHCFFLIDDSRFFCRANYQGCGNVLKLLLEYEASSSQKINKEKTALFFSKSTQDAAR